MKLIVAVSGGVDSVVLLHQLVVAGEHDLIVAHLDHGIRPDSGADARFVEALAKSYGLVFEMHREELGAYASEEQAREKRYEFLFGLAEKCQARVVTAHHMDDVVETVVLNISRGTRWRGLSGMSDDRIWRPLTRRTKSELIEYALGERLEWVEDETNHQDTYSRNRIRKTLTVLPRSKKQQVYELWQKQTELRQKINREIIEADFPVHSRYFIIMIGPAVAHEILYEYTLKETGVSLLKPQLENMHMAIKTGRPGTTWQIGQGLIVKLSLSEWRAELDKR